MSNTYEFNIEDINSVIAIDVNSSCNYKTEYTRIINKCGEYQSKYFVETSHSDPIIEDNTVKIVCERCGTWNSYPIEDYNSDKFDKNNICPRCESNYKNLYSENEIISIIMSFMDKEIFDGIKLIINDTEIN